MKTRITIILATTAIVAALIWTSLQPKQVQINTKPPEIDWSDPARIRNTYIKAFNIYSKVAYEKQFEHPDRIIWKSYELGPGADEFKMPYTYGTVLDHKKLGLITEESAEKYLEENQ